MHLLSMHAPASLNGALTPVGAVSELPFNESKRLGCKRLHPSKIELPRGDYPPSWMPDFKEPKVNTVNMNFDSPFIVPVHGLVFCKVSKVASSGFMRLMRRMEGHTDWKGNPYFIKVVNNETKYRVGGLRQLHHLPHQDALRVLRHGTNWTRVVIVRDPAERLLSAYLDKIHPADGHGSDSVAQLNLYAQRLFVPSLNHLPQLPFADFVKRVAFGLAHGIFDQHWLPLSANCDLRNWLPAYDLVLQMRHGDDMNKLLDCVLARVSRSSSNPAALANLRDTFNLTSKVVAAHGTASATEKYYTPELLQRVMEMYAEDYALFNMPTPTHLL